jgi:hypothetical protein
MEVAMSTLPLSFPSHSTSLSPALSLTMAKPSRWTLLGPVLGMLGAAALMLLPQIGIGSMESVYAAFSLGIASLYLALIPSCERGGRAALLLAVANAAAALTLFDWSSAMHAWLSLQTVIAAVWLVRDQNSGARALAGLLVGLNAGAVAAMGFSLPA